MTASVEGRRHRQQLLAVLCAGLLASCAHDTVSRSSSAAPSCPVGSRPDAPRAAKLIALLEGDEESAALDLGKAALLRVCFLPGSGPGVLSGGLAILDADDSDLVLAARLAHLGIHYRDNLGDGCTKGLEQARESERKAFLLESRLRQRYGLPALAPAPAAGSDSDYQFRCPPA